MRVIAGTRKGIPLKSLPGISTRPTTDKVKESLFNIIGPYFDGGVAVELFGGSGSLSLEALSRGMEKAIIFEKNMKACSIIRQNSEKCRFVEEVQVVKADARKAVSLLTEQQINVDVLFVDPPYAEVSYYDLVQQLDEQQLLADDVIVVCEHEKQFTLPEHFGTLEKIRTATYGNTAISIYERI